MKNLSIAVFGALLLMLLAILAGASVAGAQTVTPIWDPSRLSIGARLYRSFDENPTVAGSYVSGWWGGLVASHEITSPHDPNIVIPMSLIAAFDFGMPNRLARGYVGGQGLITRGAGAHDLHAAVRAYRSFEERLGSAGSYSSDWWAGIGISQPLGMTPFSLIGAGDASIPGRDLRAYLGIHLALKKAAS